MNDGNTATASPVSPVFNPEDAMQTRSFFEKIADTIVEASELRKIVAEMRRELNFLREDIDKVRNENWRMDQEIVELRGQRDRLLAESAEKGKRIGELELENANLVRSNSALSNHLQDADEVVKTFRNDFGSVGKERDDAQFRTMELEETLRKVEAETLEWRAKAEAAESKLATLKGIFA